MPIRKAYNPDLVVNKQRMAFNVDFVSNHNSPCSHLNLFRCQKDILSKNVGQSGFIGKNKLPNSTIKALHKMLSKKVTFGKLRKLLHKYSKIPQSEKGEKGEPGLPLIPTSRMARFMKKYINKFVPKNIFGGTNFRTRFSNNIKYLFRRTSHQAVTLHLLIYNVIGHSSFKDCIRAKVLLWLVEDVLTWVIKQICHVTEYSKMNGWIFMSHPTWEKFHRSSLKSMVKSGCLTASGEDSSVKPPLVLRFIPKVGTGFRPLAINRAKLTMSEKEKIDIAKSFIRCIVQTNKGPRTDNAVKNLGAVWKTFHEAGFTKCYFVRVDLKDAFGSIIQKVLIDIINEKFTTSMYFNEGELTVHVYKDKSRERFQYFFPHLAPITKKNINFYKKTTILESEVRSVLLNYIQNTVVSLGNISKNYKVTKGLIQGGRLSPALCELYYTSFDENLKGLLSPDDIFLRVADDYLLISPHRHYAERFRKTMEAGFPEWGVTVQPRKTLSNLTNPSLKEFPFYGFLLNIVDHSVKPHLASYTGTSFESRFTFKASPVWLLKFHMQKLIALKLNWLTLSPTFHTLRKIFENIYSSCCVLALRFHAICQITKPHMALSNQSLKSGINKATSVVKRICSRVLGKLIGDYGWAYRCIAYMAFVEVLKVNRDLYLEVEHQCRRFVRSLFKKLSNKEKRYIEKLRNTFPKELKKFKRRV